MCIRDRHRPFSLAYSKIALLVSPTTVSVADYQQLYLSCATGTPPKAYADFAFTLYLQSIKAKSSQRQLQALAANAKKSQRTRQELSTFFTGFSQTVAVH